MAAQDEGGKSDRLDSWKAVADYLKIPIRTCQNWEQKGLPVRRIGDSPGAHVYAFKRDLDIWLEKHQPRATGAESPGPNSGGASPKRRRHWAMKHAVAGGILAGVAGLAFLAWQLLLPGLAGRSIPADIRIEGTHLLILDRGGRVIGDFDTGIEGLWDTEHYRHFLQNDSIGSDNLTHDKPRCVFRDIDGDRDFEVLYVPFTRDEESSGVLYCLDAKGREIWRYTAGRAMSYGGTYFPAAAIINGIDTFDWDGDGRREIVVVSHALGEFPTQISVLSAAGERIGEYWNAGQIQDFHLTDVDGDGRPELLFGGMNNEYGQAALIAFDPAKRMEGGSPQIAGDYVTPGLAKGTEKYYVRLPRTEPDRVLSPVAAVAALETFDDIHALRVLVAPSMILFNFERGWANLQPRLGHEFETRYRDLFEKGKIREAYDPERIRNELSGGARFWNGDRWVPEPTANLRSLR
jgi:hypothetical protein